jgi:protein TonB
MTAASIYRGVPTANDIFKGRYAASIRVALAAALIVHLVAFVLAPTVTVRPYATPPKPPIFIEELPDPTVRAFTAIPDDPLPPRPSPWDAKVFEPSPETPLVEVPPAPEIDAAPRPGGLAPGEFVAFFEEPVLVEFVSPRYPRLAKEAGIEGRVLVRVRVEADGRVSEASVLEADVTEAMMDAALRAARQCRFNPARQRNVAVRTDVTIPFVFKLR